MLYKILRFLAGVFSNFFFRLEVRGKNNIPRIGGFILASNHASYLDPIVLAVACPRRLSFMARDNLFSIPFFGALLRKIGVFPLRRDYADISSIKEAIRRLKQAGGLLVFPEGTRASESLEQKAKPGVSFIAAKSRVPLVPAFVQGSNRALRRNARFIRPAKIKVYFGSPVYPGEGGIKDNYEDFATRVMQKIKQLNQE
ncbi:MAG: lysophospholipid acyltransferase family protein [Candidatus Omnitrophota bacterium]